jgi:hypothetical protein
VWGIILVEFLWWNFFPPHTKFHQIVEYLRLGGIFRGKFPQQIPPRPKTLEECTPFPPALLRNFEFLEEFYCTY